MKKMKFLNFINLPVIAVAMNAGTALAGTEAVAPAPSPVSTPDWLKVSGYAAVSYGYTDTDVDFDGGGGFSDDNDTLFDSGANNLDSVKLMLEATQGPFKAVASLFYVPEFEGNAFYGGSDAGILDAYVSYTSGSFTVTAGKYLSWLGYEAFDAVNLATLTFANSGVGAIPAYHTGVKFEYITDMFAAGFNVSDSVIQGDDGFWGGDEDYGNGLGYEAYVVYKGIDKLTLWGGIGLDDTDDLAGDNFVTYDFWASYDITDKMTVAGEIAYNENGFQDGIQGLLFLKYAFTEQFSTVFRFGYDTVDYDGGGEFDGYKYTIAPAYAFNEHFTLRGELSYTDGDVDDFADTDTLFAGVQALLKF